MKRKLIILASAILLPRAAHAEFVGEGSIAPLTTVAAALQAADDSLVLLEGNILRQIDKEHYEFKDATGTARVEIDRKHLPAEKFSAQSTVRLRGKVDKELSGREIEVRQVEVLK